MASKPFVREKSYEMPDIFRAADNNDVEELKLALLEGQRLDAVKSDLLNMTPIHIACIKSSNEFLRVAVPNETCDPWLRDNNLRVAFDHAAAKNNKFGMQILFDRMYPTGPDGKPVMPF